MCVFEQGSREVEGYPWVAEAEGEPIEGPYMICYKQYHKRQSDAILADPTRATGFAQHPTVTGGNPIVRPSKILRPGPGQNSDSAVLPGRTR